MQLIELLFYPVWLVLGCFLYYPSHDEKGRVWTIALLGLGAYAVGLAGFAVLYYLWQFYVLRLAGAAIAVLGHALLFGWLCSSGGATLTLTPVDATVDRLLHQSAGQERMMLQPWGRTSTLVAAAVAAVDLSLVLWVSFR